MDAPLQFVRTAFIPVAKTPGAASSDHRCEEQARALTGSYFAAAVAAAGHAVQEIGAAVSVCSTHAKHAALGNRVGGTVGGRDRVRARARVRVRFRARVRVRVRLCRCWSRGSRSSGDCLGVPVVSGWQDDRLRLA